MGSDKTPIATLIVMFCVTCSTSTLKKNCKKQSESSRKSRSVDFVFSPLLMQHAHKTLFCDVYDWAGQLRTVNIKKGQTFFCTAERILPEAQKIFSVMERSAWFAGMGKPELVVNIAEAYGDLNVIHPFREGNGRAQRLLFEQIIINAGFPVDWWLVKDDAWVPANIDAVSCDYRGLVAIFERCIGEKLAL